MSRVVLANDWLGHKKALNWYRLSVTSQGYGRN